MLEHVGRLGVDLIGALGDEEAPQTARRVEWRHIARDTPSANPEGREGLELSQGGVLLAGGQCVHLNPLDVVSVPRKHTFCVCAVTAMRSVYFTFRSNSLIKKGTRTGSGAWKT